jgi:hypothetical protein
MHQVLKNGELSMGRFGAFKVDGWEVETLTGRTPGHRLFRNGIRLVGLEINDSLRYVCLLYAREMPEGQTPNSTPPDSTDSESSRIYKTLLLLPVLVRRCSLRRGILSNLAH